MYYPEEVVEEVGRANDIVDIIGQYVKLKRQGSRYTGLCPFHNEKTPSFSVSADSQMYYCFGCHAGGNIFTFVMEYESYTFQEAVVYLAERANITLPTESSANDRISINRENKRKKMLEANKLAAKYFHYQLKSKNGEKALEYLKNRGLSDETILKFGLGYSCMYSDDLYKYLKGKGFDDGILMESGLVKSDSKGSYDLFWNRVMFPIMDIQNRVIGFGGRVMGDGLPKYINSPETMIFDKSRNLYGLNVARRSRSGYFLLCEGYMDVISLQQAGFTNAIASLGTAFTIQHAAIIKKYVKEVILTFDSDGAGINAALRAFPMLRDAGIDLRVINMKPYKDPDEFIKALGAEAFKERIENARNGQMFVFDRLRANYKLNDPAQMTRFQNDLALILLEDIEDKMERDNYIHTVCEDYGINESDLKDKIRKMSVGLLPGESFKSIKEEQEKYRKEARKKVNADERAQRMLISFLVQYPVLYGQIKDIVTEDDFSDESCKNLIKLIFDKLEKGKELNPSEIINHFINDEEEYKVISEILNSVFEKNNTKEENEKIFADLVKKVKSDTYRKIQETTSDMNIFKELMQKKKALSQFKVSL